MVKILEIPIEEYKTLGSKFTIHYGRHPTPFGECLIGVTGAEKAVCFLWFVDDDFEKCLEKLKKEWPNAGLVEIPARTGKIVERIFTNGEQEDVSVMLRGTDFQVKVWKALTEVPKGETTTYSAVAEKIGNPKAIRAAGTAMKMNRVAFLVPCHRVTSKAGENKYRWGPERRMRIMEYEKRQRELAKV